MYIKFLKNSIILVIIQKKFEFQNLYKIQLTNDICSLEQDLIIQIHKLP